MEPSVGVLCKISLCEVSVIGIILFIALYTELLCSFNVPQAESVQYSVRVTASTDTQTYWYFLLHTSETAPKWKGSGNKAGGAHCNSYSNCFILLALLWFESPLSCNHSQPSGVSLHFHGNMY